MPIQVDKIFLGHTPKDQRRFIYEVLKFSKDKYPVVKIPCVGMFTLARCAIMAGYSKENILTSDISLFTSLFGYLFSGKPVDDLPFELCGDSETLYKKQFDDVSKIACLLYLMKLSQLGKMNYLRMVFEDVRDNPDKYIKGYIQQIEQMKQFYGGIKYEIKDIRDELVDADKAITIINPPVFEKGYQKMFDFDNIAYICPIQEFSFKKEYKNLYNKTKALTSPFVWYRFRNVDEFDETDVVFAKEYGIGKTDFWLLTKPEIISGCYKIERIATFKRKKYRPLPYPLFSDKDEITDGSKIRFIKISKEQALYYRDMFAHKLGHTDAETHFAMTVDGKVYSVVGFTMSHVNRFQSDKAFENYGFSVFVKRYPHTNRLLMLAITCKSMKDVLRSLISKNRLYSLNGVKTTCLSKYRTIKTHHGILNRISRETLPNGMYKIQAETDFHDITFDGVIKKFLEEEKQFGTREYQ